MVEMAMGQQNFVQPAKAEPGAQELALRALSTVDHEAMLVYHHQRRGHPRCTDGADADVPKKTSSNTRPPAPSESYPACPVYRKCKTVPNFCLFAYNASLADIVR
jgi:hypothetical protein